MTNLQNTIKNIEKRFGKEAIAGTSSDVEFVSSGVMSLDLALGGGFPKGRIVEVYGAESSSKSTLALTLASQVQKLGKAVGYIDMEHCLSGNMSVYIPSMGINKRCIDLYYEKSEFDVLSYVDGTFKQQKATIKKTGKKEVFELKLKYGSKLELTENHEVLTSNGYKRVSDLKCGDILFQPTEIPNLTNERDLLFNNDLDLFFLLGFYLGDGVNLNSSSTPVISKKDKETLNFIDKIVNRYGCELNSEKNGINHRISCKIKRKYEIKDMVKLFKSGFTIKELSDKYNISKCTLKNYLIEGGVPEDYNFRKHASSLRNKKREYANLEKENIQKDYINEITEFLSQFDDCFLKHDNIKIPANLSLDELRYFLAGFICADGTVVDTDNQNRASLSITTSSSQMIKDLQMALLKFGIVGNLSLSKKDGYNDCYMITINGLGNFKLVNKYIPLISYKKDRVDKALKSVSSLNRNIIMGGLRMTPIKSINSIGYIDVFDISVKNDMYENQNFICENIIIHNCFDPYYASNLGVNLDDDMWIMSQSDSGEDGLEIVRELVRCEDIGLVVIDSVPALIPKAVLQGEAGDAKIGLLARLLSQTLPTILKDAQKNETIVLFINQIRQKIGVFYGPTTTTPGGEALKFYSSQRIELSKAGQNKDGDEITSSKIRFKVQKNKVAPPFKKAEVNVLFGEGYDILGETIDLGVDFSIIDKKGSWFSYGETKLGQGKDSVKEILKDNPELFEEIKEKVINKVSVNEN